MVTMKEVAKEAGVSLGTVSNVINNLPSVSEENRKKVLDAIEKLKYRPNIAARTLKTKTSKSLGLIIPDITNPFYPEVARGAEDAARKYGYSIFLCNNDRSVEKEREYINILSEKNVDGLILVKPQITPSEINEIKEHQNIVLVDIDYETVSGCDLVNVNDYNGTMKALEYLYDLGHRRIALISGMLESKSSMSRRNAFLKFHQEHNLEVDESLIKIGTYNWHSGYNTTLELLENSNRPTAIFAANDLMAIGAMKAVRQRQLLIPEDISVVGFDDVEMASLCTPLLTTVRQPKYEIGMHSVELLFERINGKGSRKGEAREIRTATLETELIIRESAGFVR